MNDLMKLESFANTMHVELTRLQLLLEAGGPFHSPDRAADLIEKLAGLACTQLVAAKLERTRMEAAMAPEPVGTMTDEDFAREGWSGPGLDAIRQRMAVTAYGEAA